MINVVIADDDYNVRAGLSDMIDWKALNANIVAALEDGEQVIELLKQNDKIDLVILDICMPYMDGLTVAKYIRENSYAAEIVLLSAHADFDYAREALRYDIKEYILKPISRAKLKLLSDVIKSVAEEKEEGIKWRLYLRGTELAEETKNALRYQDMQAIEKLLDTESRFGAIGVKKIKEYYSVLMGLFWDYYKNSVADRSMLENQMKAFYEISDIKNMKNFLKEKFSLGIHTDDTDAKKTGVNIVSLAKEYINDNVIGSELSSYSVASHFNLSVDYLSRLFKNAGEDSLSDCIIQAKINRAKDIIANSSHSIRRIAEILGYTDTSYFIRIFKKKIGVTPKEFRMQLNKREE
ncbi:MAG: response regulator [Clostridia bacterium]|nr:response regulator [Clostridia bacterium]